MTPPAIGSRWKCLDNGVVYRVVGHRGPGRATNGRTIKPAVLCERDGRQVVISQRSFQPGAELHPLDQMDAR